MKISDLVPALALGDRVRFNATLVRAFVHEPLAPGSNHYAPLSGRKVWERRETPTWLRTGPQEGVIVGARTVYDGSVEYGWEDNPTVFRPDTSHRVYLVATGLRTKHLTVRVEDVEPL